MMAAGHDGQGEGEGEGGDGCGQEGHSGVAKVHAEVPPEGRAHYHADAVAQRQPPQSGSPKGRGPHVNNAS
jgi:hypothetical protein